MCYGLVMDNQPDSELSFARPPIVEAVIERRFPDPIDIQTIEALRKRFELVPGNWTGS
jgi:hypothetical protein